MVIILMHGSPYFPQLSLLRQEATNVEAIVVPALFYQLVTSVSFFRLILAIH